MKSYQTHIVTKGVFMEEISYINGILWYLVWPLTIYISYKFIRVNIEHLENNLEKKTKQRKNK